MPVEGEKLFHRLRVCVSWTNFERKDFFLMVYFRLLMMDARGSHHVTSCSSLYITLSNTELV